jgi:hypothetical protein
MIPALLALSSSMQAQAIANPQRREMTARLANPQTPKQELLLLCDLLKDGRVKVISKYSDLHDGTGAEFRISELKLAQGKGEFGEELFRLKTTDDYCLGIELKDVNEDGLPDILFYTASRDRAHENLYIVYYEKEGGRFQVLGPDVPFRTLQARYGFQPKTSGLPAELTVDSVISSPEIIFAAPNPAAGQLPQFWLRQVYRVVERGLVLYSSASLETPYYALSCLVSALGARDFFASYKYVFMDSAYEDYRQKIQKDLPLLCARQTGGRFQLSEWSLEMNRDTRTQGWIIFIHSFQAEGRERRITWQAFMRKIYDEWKITSIRKLQET